MLLWLLLLTLAPGRERPSQSPSLGVSLLVSGHLSSRPASSRVAPKAFLLLEPPWSTAFKGETVTLLCRDPHSPARENVSWYCDGILLTKKSEEIQIKKSGYYSCKTHRSSLSDRVHVEFSPDWLILQAPHPVFEGDDVALRCQGRKEKESSKKTYYKDGKELGDPHQSDTITLHSVSKDDGSSAYHCTASRTFLLIPWPETSKPLRIQVQELFPRPLLTASPSQPMEGGPVTLTCETRLPLQRPHAQLQFCFFREDRALGSGCSGSPELQIPAMWSEDSGSYWCQAQTATLRVVKRSPGSRIRVRRVPVSDVNLEIQPSGGQLIEGENLVLVCSVAQGTGAVTFSWHREGTLRSLGRKTERALSAELQLPGVRQQDAGRYYCAADNIHGPVLSQRVAVTLRIPASRPVLTLRTSGAPAVPGDTVELRCEARRGSPPVLYRFYHEDVALGSSPAPSGGGASFNLSLTAEHAGNYSCEASNGLGAQRSEAVPLRVAVPVSRPVLTLHPAGAQAVPGDTVELRCEAQRGSPPILYWFYHDNVTLGSSWAPSGGGASFHLPRTAGHSENYSCAADNGLGAQRSEVVPLRAAGPSRSKTILTVGLVGGLLSVLGLAATAAWMGHFRCPRDSGGLSAAGAPSYDPHEGQEHPVARPCSPHTRGFPCTQPPAVMGLQPVYSNVGPGSDTLIYSQVCSFQPTKGNSEASSPRKPQEDKEPAVIYSELKKGHPDGSPGRARSTGRAHGDATENYENVPCASPALEP